MNGVAQIAISADSPAREFRLFAAGWNDTEKGRYLFDDEAAKATMSAYQRHSVDRMIDLEHLSLDDENPNFDPDARGWCKLELRNGELYAVDVRWTADGEARLREKRQRYISPAFAYNKETKRVTKVLNIALTAMPATWGTSALIAASAKGNSKTMTNDYTKYPKTCEALDAAIAAGAKDADIASAISALGDAGSAEDAEGGRTLSVNGKPVKLSAREIATCREHNVSLAAYAERKLANARPDQIRKGV
jgi:phage I-like protein